MSSHTPECSCAADKSGSEPRLGERAGSQQRTGSGLLSALWPRLASIQGLCLHRGAPKLCFFQTHQWQICATCKGRVLYCTEVRTHSRVNVLWYRFPFVRFHFNFPEESVFKNREQSGNRRPAAARNPRDAERTVSAAARGRWRELLVLPFRLRVPDIYYSL